MNRRFFLLSIPAVLSACASGQKPTMTQPKINPYWLNLYGAVDDEAHPIPAVDLTKINPVYLRREVSYSSSYPVGTLVIDTRSYFCYLVMPEGRAMRYGVGVAKNSFENLAGEASVGRKAMWPHWTPTKNMMRKQPERYGHLGSGMKPGPTNPLGARALYLYRNGRDTLFRLHGTNEPWSIGTNVSSGCIRFLNQDIIDLYGRVPTGTRVVILA